MTRRLSRGLTLLEIMVSVAILAMVSILIYGAFDGLQKSRTGLARINDRYHVGRATLRRIAEEMSSAFVSLHMPYSSNLVVRKTAFVAKDSSPADRIDMTTFSHKRVVSGSKESDQNEISYFGCPDPAVAGKYDLCRREQTIIDVDPQRGGVVYVIAEDIDLFDVKFLDPMSGLWNDSWDTTQAIGQMNRMPVQVRVTLVLRGGPRGKPIRFEEKLPIAITEPVAFAVPR